MALAANNPRASLASKTRSIKNPCDARVFDTASSVPGGFLVFWLGISLHIMTAQKQHKTELTATKREVTGSKVKHVRAEGLVPAVLYGKDLASMNIQVPVKEFGAVLREAGESSLVYLTVDGQTYPTLIHDIAREPLSGEYIHADFYKVDLKEKIKANVPVVFTGESPAVKDLGGIFVRNINELEVEALPTDLPHELAVDISRLAAIGDQLMAKDIVLGQGVTLVTPADEVIALIQEPISEEELKASLEEPTTAVEDVEEIKKEEKPAEEEGAEEAPAPEAPAPAPEAKE